MPTSSPLYDPEFWKKRVEEARTLAEGMNDTYAKILMMGTAEVYEKIANSYESLARWKEHQLDHE